VLHSSLINHVAQQGLNHPPPLGVSADCCHSGTLLDQPEVQISGPKTDDPAAPPQLIDTFTAGLGGDNRDVSGR
jgi:hypothetical protein